MKTNLITTVIFSSVLAATSAQAATGLLGQPGTNPTDQATDYDVMQDNSNSAIANLANSALGTVTQLNHQVGQNVADIKQMQQSQGNFVDKPTYATDKANQAATDKRQDDAITAETNRAHTEEQKQWNEIQTKYTEAAGKALEGRVTNNEKAIAGKVDQKVYDNDRVRQLSIDSQQDTDIAANTQGVADNKAELAKKVDQTTYNTGVQRQNTINSSINRKNQDQDASITGLRTDVDTNKQGVADNKAALANKVETSTFTTDQQRQDAITGKNTQAIADNAAEIATSKTNINTLADKIKQETTDRKTADTDLQNKIDTKADKAQVSALANSTSKSIQALVDDGKLQDKAIANNAGDINANRLTNNRQQTAIDDNTKAIAGKVDDSTYKGDQAKQAKYDGTQDLGIAEATQDALAAQNTADRNTKALNDKVDNSTFTTDQQRQDGALQQEVTDRTNADTQLSNKIDTKADAIQVATNKKAIEDEVQLEATHYQTLSTTKVDQATQTGVDSKQDHGISEAIQDATDAQKTADNNSDHIDTVEKTEAKHFTTLTSGLSQKVETSTFSQRSAAVDKYLADAKAERAATNATVARHTSELANHEQRISELEKNTNASFSNLKHEVESNRRRASAAISGVAAMANIPQVIESQTFNVGAGVGTTDGETAVAVGFSARASEHVVVKASVSNDTQHNFVVGGGVSYGW